MGFSKSINVALPKLLPLCLIKHISRGGVVLRGQGLKDKTTTSIGNRKRRFFATEVKLLLAIGTKQVSRFGGKAVAVGSPGRSQGIRWLDFNRSDRLSVGVAK